MSCNCNAVDPIKGEVIFIGKSLKRGIDSLPDGIWIINREASGYGFGGSWEIAKSEGKITGLEMHYVEEDKDGHECHEEVVIESQLRDFLGLS